MTRLQGAISDTEVKEKEGKKERKRDKGIEEKRIYLEMGGGGGIEFLVVGDPEEIETRIKDAFDRLLQKLLEDAILIDAGFVQSLTAQITLSHLHIAVQNSFPLIPDSGNTQNLIFKLHYLFVDELDSDQALEALTRQGG